MPHRSFPTSRTIEAAQQLLDNRTGRSHPKRHRVRKRRAKRNAAARAKGKARAAINAAAKSRYKAQVRAYFAGTADTRPD